MICGPKTYWGNSRLRFFLNCFIRFVCHKLHNALLISVPCCWYMNHSISCEDLSDPKPALINACLKRTNVRFGLSGFLMPWLTRAVMGRFHLKVTACPCWNDNAQGACKTRDRFGFFNLEQSAVLLQQTQTVIHAAVWNEVRQCEVRQC